MRSVSLLAALAASCVPSALATPLPQASGAESCKAEDLTADTWSKLGMDTWVSRIADNVTDTAGNTIQALAASQGAPNFFCGLDSFCNAGQPCVPVQLPAWYALVAIQNWNSYMNSVNTAVTFASSIISLVLPEIVADFLPKPEDNVTPLKHVIRMFTTVLGIVPLTGAVSTTGSTVSGGLKFLSASLTSPSGENEFLTWSRVSSSMATVVQSYQRAVSDSVKTTLDAPILQIQGGIANALLGGQFLGTHQNVTQDELSGRVVDTFKIRAAALALQANRVFIYRASGIADGCKGRNEQSAAMCIQGDEFATSYGVLRLDGDGNGDPQNDAVDKLVSKYGLTREDIILGSAKCYDDNGKQQLADGFGDALPLDPKAECLFVLPICDVRVLSTGVTVPKGNSFKEVCEPQGMTL
ncbi:hypothetical protein Cob_v004828 [Colletotrichum orbiculare MAFF 240422]|uniref:DUF7872 domain-containing protein n=1 Tax=Colletotrichum orbiculare (strain 104-T / ATCC 96160 / CBS 514.97 / LARS 414 / MAFF 240422) TaxID=1213857 RepID=N4UU34_COLOR|nr:hypothetical protein Cob_v004828 [Colletotrichum orbiculare MAFF 240422]